jgi:hypothetical protein
METMYIPQRGVDFDDFIGSVYFKEQKGLENVQLNPVFCPANDRHDDDFIGIQYSGYAVNAEKKEDRGKLIQGIAYPAKDFTTEDLNRLFDEVEDQNGGKHYRAKSSVKFDEIYIRVCYSQKEGKPDTIKWVAAIDGGEAVVLHGDRRTYNPKDAEQ